MTRKGFFAALCAPFVAPTVERRTDTVVTTCRTAPGHYFVDEGGRKVGCTLTVRKPLRFKDVAK